MCLYPVFIGTRSALQCPVFSIIDGPVCKMARTAVIIDACCGVTTHLLDQS